MSEELDEILESFEVALAQFNEFNDRYEMSITLDLFKELVYDKKADLTQINKFENGQYSHRAVYESVVFVSISGDILEIPEGWFC